MRFFHALRDSTFVTFLGALLFIPIWGMKLSGQNTLDFPLSRALYMLLILFIGRMAMLFLAHKLPKNWGNKLPNFSLIGEKCFKEAHTRYWVLGLLALLVFLPFSPMTTNYHLQILSLTLIYITLGMGLNIVVGLAGLLDLGYVAFYACGAYGFALLAKYFGISFWVAIPLSALLAALVGCILGFPVLRMHGDYLAIATLGFGEIIRLLLVNLIDVTGGPNGINAPRPSVFGVVFTRSAKEEGQIPFHELLGVAYDSRYRYMLFYFLLIVLVCLSIWVFKRLREMPIGRSWVALREDEIAAKSLGINHTSTKLLAFTLGASFGGVAGVFFASMEGFINPSSFIFFESAIILSIVVLGGMGSIIGVVLAAVVITLLPEFFREFDQFRMLFFGLAMVLIMIWRPRGLFTAQRRKFINQ